MSLIIALIAAAVLAYAFGWRPSWSTPAQLWGLARSTVNTDHPLLPRVPIFLTGFALVLLALLVGFWPAPHTVAAVVPTVSPAVAPVLHGTANEVYAAVKAFQAAHGLAADGVLGPDTCSKLYRSCTWHW